MSRRKKVTGAAILLIILILLLTGTFAWVDFSQHATNLFNGESVADVRLNNAYFYPPTDWHPSSSNAVVENKVSVTNNVASNTVMYVRLQLKEYLETYSLTYTPIMDGTEVVLFATYASGPKTGEYIKATEAEAALVADFDYEEWDVYYPATYTDATLRGKTITYLRTQNAETRNGIYGKSMNDPEIMPAKTVMTIFGESVKADYPVQPHELQSASNAECNYEVHLWSATSTECGISDRLTHTDSIHNYIEWELGNVMLMSAWEATNQAMGNFWVLDESDGWAYWAGTLIPGTTTANILESVKLTNMPGEAFSYYIHTDMQAVTADELSGFSTRSNVAFMTALSAYINNGGNSITVTIPAYATGGVVARGASITLVPEIEVIGNPDTGLIWSIEGGFTRTGLNTTTADGSEIEQNGKLTIAEGETATSLTIKATSVYDDTVEVSVTITLSGPIVVDAYAEAADNDGVDLSTTTGLLTPGNLIYYGRYKHATNSGFSTYETDEIPVQWQITGSSDGNIELLSRYVLDGKKFFAYSGTPTSNINYWRDSNIRAWLNNLNYTGTTQAGYTPSSIEAKDYRVIANSGFLNNFAAGELERVATTNVRTSMFNYDTMAYISTLPAVEDKFYLPWGTYNGTSGTYKDRVWYGFDDGGATISAALGTTGISTAADKIATLKNGTAVTWWLRSPYSNSVYSALVVTTSGSVGGNNTYTVSGVRPAFRLNPESVIFTSRVVTAGTAADDTGYTEALNGYAASAVGTNYKLTVLGGNSGIDVGVLTLADIPDSTIKKVVYDGETTLELEGVNSTVGGSDYTINYKIVDIKTDPSNHTIIGYGKTAAAVGDNTLSIDTSTISAGEYVVYVWLQKNNTKNSNEATKPECFWLEVK